MCTRLLTPLPAVIEARRRADRSSRDVALAITRHLSTVPRCCPTCGHVDNRFHNARTGQRTPWGALLTYLDRATRIGTPVEVLLLIPRVIEAFIHDLAPQPPARGQRVTPTGRVLSRAA